MGETGQFAFELLALYTQKPKGVALETSYPSAVTGQGAAITSCIFQMLLIVLVAIMEAQLFAKPQSKLLIPQ